MVSEAGMTTDERRARAMWIYTHRDEDNVPLWDAMANDPNWAWVTSRFREIARAIRESDEAAGMVLVPREATEEMLTEGIWDISPWHPAYDTEEGRKAAMRDAWNGMIAAAMEANNG